MAYIRNPMLKFSGVWNKTNPKSFTCCLGVFFGVFLCQVELSAYIAVLRVSLPSSFVCECVVFLMSLIVLNLGDQNAAS